MQPIYTCSACSTAVLVIDGKIIKACRCNAAVHASASASVRGRGGLVEAKK
jgi:hypothetical protein